jgi:hypothetical protein
VNRAGFAGGSNSTVGRTILRKTTNNFSPEVCERAVRLVMDHEHEQASRHSARGIEAALER